MSIRDLVEKIKYATEYVDTEEMNQELDETLEEITSVTEKISYAKGKSWLSDIALAQERYDFAKELTLDGINVFEELRKETNTPSVIETMLGDEYLTLTTVCYKNIKEKQKRLSQIETTRGTKKSKEKSQLKKDIANLTELENGSRVLGIMHLTEPFLRALDKEGNTKKFNPKPLEIFTYRLFECIKMPNYNWGEEKGCAYNIIRKEIKDKETQKLIQTGLNEIKIDNIKQMRHIINDFYKNPDKEDYIKLINT